MMENDLGLHKKFVFLNYGHFREAAVRRCSSRQIYKRRIEYKCFPVNIAKFLRTTFYIGHLASLLLILDSP